MSTFNLNDVRRIVQEARGKGLMPNLDGANLRVTSLNYTHLDAHN